MLNHPQVLLGFGVAVIFSIAGGVLTVM